MELIKESIFHILAMILSLGAFIFALKAQRALGGKIGDSFKFIFAGIIFLVFIHVSEIIGPDTFKLYDVPDGAQEIIEHILFMVAMIFFIVGFSRTAKALKGE